MSTAAARDAYLADEAIADQVQLIRVAGGQQLAVEKLLKGLEQLLITALLAGPDLLTTWKRQHVLDMLASTRSRIAQVYTEISAANDLGVVAKSVSKKLTKDLKVVFATDEAPSGAMLKRIVDETLIMGAPSSEWWSRQADETAFRFANVVRAGVASGSTTAAMRSGVREVMASSAKGADALVRSSVAAITNAARQDAHKAHGDVLKGVRFVATLDSRTSLQCAGYSGSEWTLDGKPLNASAQRLGIFRQTPLHWNCRSVLVPLTKDLPGLPSFEPSTRASVEGPVSGSITFTSWLGSQSIERQEKLLGVGRARLFRAGKMNLQQLLDGRGNPLSTADLVARFGG